MPKLSQINAVLSAKKAETEKKVTELYKLVQKEAAFTGRSRVYRPNDEAGAKLPPETQVVQHKAADVLRAAAAAWRDAWDLTYSQDVGNKKAAADLVVDGTVVLADVPVTTLLYLDKQVNDLITFVSKLPTPDPAEAWAQDPNSGLLRTQPTETAKTSKEPTVIVKYDATDKHPAQTELFTKDVPVGTWTQTLFSGAIPADVKETYLRQLGKLQEAVKFAREEANSLVVERKKMADDLFTLAFGEDFVNRLGGGR